jgi:hypothetical protein
MAEFSTTTEVTYPDGTKQVTTTTMVRPFRATQQLIDSCHGRNTILARTPCLPPRRDRVCAAGLWCHTEAIWNRTPYGAAVRRARLRPANRHLLSPKARAGAEGEVGTVARRCVPFLPPAAQLRPYSIALPMQLPCNYHRLGNSTAEARTSRR